MLKKREVIEMEFSREAIDLIKKEEYRKRAIMEGGEVDDG